MPTVAERYKFAEVEHDGKQFMNDFYKQTKVFAVESMTEETMMKLGNKDVVARCLLNALKLIERQHNLVINQRVHLSSYQQDIIKLQSAVIDAQEKALRASDDISQAVEESVQSGIKLQGDYISQAVEESVKSGIKSYSEATVSSSVQSSSTGATVISPGTLKSIAKQLVVEEELSRNIMVFGLSEKDDEDICDSVGKVFEQLEEKPRLEARRLGIKRTNSTPRPVKVTLSSAATVQQILGKSRKLRTSQYDSVYLTPDRTAEQRAEHRQLVEQLKKKGKDEPGRHHYIKAGQIFSTELKNQDDVLK
jgi:hypothetical protein